MVGAPPVKDYVTASSPAGGKREFGPRSAPDRAMSTRCRPGASSWRGRTGPIARFQPSMTTVNLAPKNALP